MEDVKMKLTEKSKKATAECLYCGNEVKSTDFREYCNEYCEEQSDMELLDEIMDEEDK
jgi:endogenous inhibitor of DNA gyrase (YacG/DUF329 family)